MNIYGRGPHYHTLCLKAKLMDSEIVIPSSRSEYFQTYYLFENYFYI